MKMKICLITSKDPSHIGGHERLINDTATALKADINPVDPMQYDYRIVMDDISVWKSWVPFHTPYYIQLVYLTTPRRAFYDMYYFTPKWKRPLIWAARPFDRWAMNKENIVTISHNVRNRIFKYYQKDVDVVYPGIHTEKYYHKESEGYWMSVQRVDKWKRILLQVETFRKMPDHKLKIVGPISKEYYKVVLNAPKNVEFLGAVPDSELYDLYAHCEGVLATAIDEDFGYTPIEAAASGKPVIAVAEGGYLETISEYETGLFIWPKPDTLARAIKWHDLEPDKIYLLEAMKYIGHKFSYDRFKQNLLNLVTKK